MSGKVLYFLPHNDDESFVIPKIRSDIQNGKTPIILFLTRSLIPHLINVRLAESIKFLRQLGISLEDIYAVGIDNQIDDGSLHRNMPRTYQAIEEILSKYNKIEEIVTTAFEGGHQDHDASFVLAKRIAQIRKIPVYEFFLYNGYGTCGKFYKVAMPLAGKKIDIKYSFDDHYQLLKVPFYYLSQWGAILGLWPVLFWKSFKEPLRLRIASGENLFKHSEKPMYERWNRITQEEFLNYVNQLKLTFSN